MTALLASLLAAAAFAGAPAASLDLRPVGEITAPALLFSADFTTAVGWGERSVSVYRLPGGMQTARYDLPLATKGNTKLQVFPRVDLSERGDKLLIVREQCVKDCEVKGAGVWSETEVTVFLMALDGGSAKPLWTGRQKRRTDGTWVSTEAHFLGDGKRVGIMTGSGRGAGSENAFDLDLYVVDLAGKILSHAAAKATGRGLDLPPVVTGAKGLGVYGSDAPGRMIGAAQDDSGCELFDLATSKRVSFLQSCSENDHLSFGSEGLAWSDPQYSSGEETHVMKVWDTASGALLYQNASPTTKVIRASRGDVAFVIGDKTIEARDRTFRRLLAGASLSGLYGANGFGLLPLGLSPDGSLLAAVVLRANVAGGPPIQIFDTGLRPRSFAEETPEAAVHPEAVDIDQPPPARTKADPDAYAVVIGVEKYRQDGIPSVDFAARDARTMYAYLTKAMGYDAKNVVLLTDDHASRADFAKYLGQWLKNRVDAKSRVFVYYAGHGSPNPETGEGYLMPYEADPAYLEDTAFPIARLYSDLAKLPTKDVTVVLDACFSGQGGRSLIAKGARPLVQAKQELGPANAVVITAAGGAQISASDPERRHGLLTEYLLEALHGAADKRGDGKITGEEIYAYVKPAVERAARLQNVEQTPTLSGAPGDRPWIELDKPGR